MKIFFPGQSVWIVERDEFAEKIDYKECMLVAQIGKYVIISSCSENRTTIDEILEDSIVERIINGANFLEVYPAADCYATQAEAAAGRQFRFQVTENVEKRILKLHKQKMSAFKIAAIFGCSYQTVYRILHKNGMPRLGRGRQRIPQEKQIAVCKAYEEKCSIADIQSQYQLSKSSIYRILQKYVSEGKKGNNENM